ncbi:hypothetical protein ACF0H5_009888 [Mactra antiquata]
MLSGYNKIRFMRTVAQNARLFCVQPNKQVAVDKALLSKLRKKTGYPMINCKKALVQFDNDIKEAETWMREQAQKEGWEKAGKLQDRPMSQGLVGLIEDDTSVTVVEVNCETDFVAKNENFQALVSQIVKACHKHTPQSDNGKVLLDNNEINSMKDEDVTLSDKVALLVGKLGENIAIRRAASISKDSSTVVSSFVHASGPPMVKDGIKLGKFAAITKVEIPDVDGIAKELCQHIVGMNPTEMGEWRPKPIDKKELKKKKKEKEENKSRPEDKVEQRLLDQEFLLDSQFTVRSYLHDNAPKVEDFVRMECGEDLGED